MTADQVRAARALLGWSQQALALQAEVGYRSVRRLEAGEETSAVVGSSIRRALRDAGIVTFTDLSELTGLDLATGVAMLKASSPR